MRLRLPVIACLAALLAGCVSTVPTESGMDPYAKDVIDAATKLLGVLGLVIAMAGVLSAARTRKEDLRWRMLVKVEEAINRIHTDRKSALAVNMLDRFLVGDTYTLKVGRREEVISYERAIQILEEKGAGDPTSREVYASFDWFMYYVDRIAYLNAERLVRAEDVGCSLDAYTPLIAKAHTVFQQLCNDHKYSRALKFLEELRCEPPAARGPVARVASRFRRRPPRSSQAPAGVARRLSHTKEHEVATEHGNPV